MSTEALEQKVTELIARVERLEKRLRPVAKPWRAAFGRMKDSEASREAARLGEEWRKSENARE